MIKNSFALVVVVASLLLARDALADEILPAGSVESLIKEITANSCIKFSQNDIILFKKKITALENIGVISVIDDSHFSIIIKDGLFSENNVDYQPCLLSWNLKPENFIIIKSHDIIGGMTKWNGRLYYVQIKGEGRAPLYLKYLSKGGEPTEQSEYTKYRILFRQNPFDDSWYFVAMDGFESNRFPTAAVVEALRAD